MQPEKKIKEIIQKLRRENKVLPMTTDVVFKNVLQDKEMKSILTFLISEITCLNYTYVFKNITFKNTELVTGKALEKKNVTDLIVDIDKMTVNLEMNARDNEEDIIKNNFYHHNLVATTLKRGESYGKARKIIQINFDRVIKFDDRIVLKFTMRDETGKFVIDENYVNYYINMAKVFEKWYNKNELTKFEKILLIMLLEDKDKLLEVAQEDEELKLMVRKIFEQSEDPNVIGVYDKDEMNAWKMDVAKSIALEKGIEQGLEQGQRAEKLDIAKNMLSMKMNIETISKATGLSISEIEKLK